jgi:hypothetical protein
MKKKIYITSIFFVTAHFCFGQTGHLPVDTFVLRHFKYLYIVEFSDRTPIATENSFIYPDSFDVVPKSQSSAICKLLKIDDIVILKVGPKTEVLTLNGLFNRYKIPAQYRNWPVRVDDEIVNDPETMLISTEGIDQVKIQKAPKSRCINIILQGYYKDKPAIEKSKKTGILAIPPSG